MDAIERDRTRLVRDSIDRFIRMMRLHHRIVERRVEGCGVHHSQHRLLMKISFLGRSASQKALAEAMEVSPACVARMLKGLEAAGYVKKAEGADGRCNEISLLPAGQRVVEDSQALFRQIGEEMFEGISGAEIEAMGRTLEKLLINLSNMEKRDAEPVARSEGDDRR